MKDEFEEMSESFKRAFGYSNSRNYKESIPLYDKAIQEDSNNFAAYNNRALAKINVAIGEKDKTILQGAISDLEEAIRITKEFYKYEDGYPTAEGNLNWAKNEFTKLSKNEN